MNRTVPLWFHGEAVCSVILVKVYFTHTLSPWVIRPNALWSDIHTPSITSVTFHFIKSSVHLMVRLRYRAMCERTTVDDELNMAGLNIDLVGQRCHYSVSFHNLLTSSDITA